MSSRRVYITLNDTKEKDRVIEAYLSLSYSESDAIKEALYRLAINSNVEVQIGADNNDKAKKVTKDTKKVQKKPKSDKKDYKGIKDNDKVQIGTEDTFKIDLDTISGEVVQSKPNRKELSEIETNEMSDLLSFL